MSEMIKNLEFVLADTYVLYTKIQNFHWNVRGECFVMWHTFFETLYKELQNVIGPLAERTRQLGGLVNGSMRSFLANASLEEARGDETAREMVAALTHDYEKLIQLLRGTVGVAHGTSDIVTEDFLTSYLALCEKALWMLKSSASKA